MVSVLSPGHRALVVPDDQAVTVADAAPGKITDPPASAPPACGRTGG